MFTTIFKYELKHWLRQPSIYIYAILFLLMALLSMAGTAEAFDEHSIISKSTTILNSSWRINAMVDFFTKLVLLILPAVFGASVFRDFKNNVHTVLYSYPFSKRDYLLGKFLSAALVMSLVVIAIPLGIFLGTKIPTVNAGMLVDTDVVTYLQTYFVYLLPNVLIMGLVVFAVVVYTRNVYAGFVSVVLLLAVQAIFNAVLGNMDNRFYAALFDPLGKNASIYYLRSWSRMDLNILLVPVKGVVVYNRLLWLGFASVLFFMMYRTFSFSQNAYSFSLRKKQGERLTKNNFGNILKVNLPKVNFDFSFFHQLKTTWAFSNFDFKYIYKNWMFVIIVFAGIVFVLLQQLQISPDYGFKTLPVTWKMLEIPAFLFSGAILILTYLFAGMLVHRDRVAKMNHLVDASPVSNWSLLFSKFIALVKMQLLLLSFILLGGVLAQIIQGYYHFEFGQYLFRLVVVMLPSFIAWAMAALLVQTFFPNAYLGFFILLLSSSGASLVPDQLGLEHTIFKFGNAPMITYSDLDGYGDSLWINLLYRTYWLWFGSVLLCLTLLIWVRGISFSFKERMKIVSTRWKGKLAWVTVVLFIGFISFGFAIYNQDVWKTDDPFVNVNWEKIAVDNEKEFKPYAKIPQPKIEAINIHLDLFPKSKDFFAKGTYVLKNDSNQPMDTILVRYSFDEEVKYELEKPNRQIRVDTVLRYGLHVLENSLAAGDSLIMTFEVRNRANTFFHKNSSVVENGTFLSSEIFPKIGYRKIDLRNNEKRKKYGLSPMAEQLPFPSDSLALKEAHTNWVNRFEATVSTSADQIAIAPGYLQKEWKEKGRRFFHYKMNSKIRSYFGFNSARYEVAKDEWQGISLEIYYHKTHTHNVPTMMKGLKSALAYNIKNFGTYQHQQARIIEFPITYGEFNTVFANSVPFSENTFIVAVDKEKEEVIDFPFKVAAHEIAHQWWAHQFITADVLGKKILTESMAEYVATQVLEQEFGTEKKRQYLKYTMDSYLRGRRRESKEEMPLVHARPNQKYLNYRKGVIAMCTMSDYLGEKKFNKALRNYLEKIKFNEAPYTTSIELIDEIKKATPDSLQYLILDLFETMTFYNNKITESKVTKLENGKYQVDMEFFIQKYRTDGNGKQFFENENSDSIFSQNEKSLPLKDYLEIGVFDVDGKTIYLQNHKITEMNPLVSIIVEKQPIEIGIDPFQKFFDVELEDNRKAVKN